MFHMLCFLADDRVGRLHAELFDQQTKMEILLSDVLHGATLRFRDRDTGDFKPACQWDGVICNEDGDVTMVDFFMKGIDEGSMSLDFLPETLESIDITDCLVEGTITAAKFPHSLTSLIVSNNHLSGAVAFEEVHDNMQALYLNNNEFSGTVDFEHLPEALRYLLLEKNAFEGSVVLTRLPRGMCLLNCSFNKLSGSLNLSSLPVPLQTLQLNHNQLSGQVIVNTLGIRVGLRGNRSLEVVDETGEKTHSSFVHLR